MNQKKTKELAKRKWAYLQPPKKFEISPCHCGEENTLWSEYEEHIWCPKCQIDFKPKNIGIFSSPIPINLAKLMGIAFHRIILETNEIQALGYDHKYVKVIELDNLNSNSLFEIIICQENEQQKLERYKAKLFISQHLNLISEVNQIYNGHYHTIIHTYHPHHNFKEWSLEINANENELKFVENGNYEKFKSFLFALYLENKLENNKEPKRSKI